MNSKPLHDMVQVYPVTICTWDQVKIQGGRFVIPNTDTSQVPGEHWLTFYFPKRGPLDFFGLLGIYGVGLENILNKK